MAPIPLAMLSSPARVRALDKAAIRPGDLAGIVRHYQAELQQRAARELRFFRIQRTFADAIDKAALAQRPDGKRFSHQRRIPRAALESGRRRLRRVEGQLASASNFANLFSIVEQAIADIPNIGELTIYDTALRIAAWRQLEPGAVYLHAGTRGGAKALGFSIRGRLLSVVDLPRPLRQLPPHEIEDVLCIYKNVLVGRHAMLSNPRSTCNPRVAR